MRNDRTQHESAVDAYLARLKTFLMTPEHGDGSGWPDIKQEALQEAHDLSVELLELKWGVDSDLESPVKVRMWAKRAYRPVCDWAFISSGPGEGETPDATEARLLNNLSAVQGASATCADALRLIHVEMAALHNRKMRRKAAFEVVQVTYKPTAEWDAGPHKGEKPVSLHLSVADAVAFTATCPKELGLGQPPEVVRQRGYLAMPPYRENPADGFAEYRKKVTALCGQVVPHYSVVHPLNLQSTLD